MTTIEPAAAPDPGRVLSARERRVTVAAAAAGNFVEWYDAGVYGLAAVVISTKLFPETLSPGIALLNTYAIFAISYILRPLGGLIFGPLADRVGRRRALSITIMFTSLATGLIGFIPEYGTIGVAAPILLLLLRTIQSLGTGGEYTSAISFVYEHGAKGHKASAVGAVTSLTFVGFLVGSLFATILSVSMPAAAYASIGWRVLFILAIPMGLVGLYLRRRTEEGPEFKALQRFRDAEEVAPTPLRDAFRLYWKRMLLFFVFLASWVILGTTLTNYLPTYLQTNKEFTPALANGANLLASAMVVIVLLIFSRFADRMGLRTTTVVGCIVVVVFVLPGFLIAGSGLAGGFIGAAILGAVKGIFAVPMLLATSQIFPAGVRVTAGGFSYNLGNAILGGTAPLIGVALTAATGTSVVFSLYIMVFAVLSLIIMLAVGRKWIAEGADHSGDTGSIATIATPSDVGVAPQ